MYTETLKTALIEIDWLREREARMAAENAVLLRGLARVQSHTRPDDAIRSVLDGLCEDFDCDLAVLVEFDDVTQRARLILSSSRELEGQKWHPGRAIFDKSRCFVSLETERTGTIWPDALSRMSSMICVPTSGAGVHKSALACFSIKANAFSAEQLSLLGRVAFLAARSAQAILMARRNAVLTAMLGAPGQDTAGLPEDTGRPTPGVTGESHEMLSRAQTIILESLIDLIDAPVDETEESVQGALAQLGSTLGLDAICLLEGAEPDFVVPVFQWRRTPVSLPEGALLRQFRLSELLAAYPSLSSGDAVQLADCSVLGAGDPLRAFLAEDGIRSALLVPLLERGAPAGIAMFKSARSARVFDLAEIYVLQAFANLIASVAGKLRSEAALSRTQLSLRAERNRLNAILSALPDLVIEIGPDGKIASVHSQTIAALTGNPDLLIGTEPRSFLTSEHFQVYQEMCTELRLTGVTQNREVRIILRGTPHWFLLSGTTFYPEAHEGRSSFIFVARNVTEERARREDVEQLSMIARRTSNLVILTDSVGKIVWVNKAFEQRTGYGLDEVLGRSPGSLLHGPETEPETAARMRAAIEAGEGVQVEIVNYDRQGNPYWVEVDIQPTRNIAGEISGFMSVQVDITDQKQKIADLERSERQARADRTASMDASRDGIAITDASGHYVYMNPAHRIMFGFDQSTDIMKVHWRALYRPETLAVIDRNDLPELGDKRNWQGELVGQRVDGTPVMQEVSLTVQDDGGIVCITRDIGERIEAEAERARLREVLQRAQRQEVIGQLAAGLAHDFNNLIAAIAGSAALIRDQSDPASVPHAARILTAAERASELMQRVLDQGARTEQRQRINIPGLLDEVADLIKSSLPRSLQLSILCEHEGVVLEADPTDVLQVILNLVINARDALPPAMLDPRIQIAGYRAEPAHLLIRPETGFLDPRKRYYVFEVADNGLGMTSDVKNKIFEPYFTTKGDRGTGLGLMIVASIVEANKGAVSVETQSGSGTRIRIFWPVPESMSAPASGKDAGAVLSAPPELLSARILVAEDNISFLEVLTALLENAGAKIGPFSTPLDALEAFRQAPGDWDILITDFDMPVMNGAELAYHIRQIRPDMKAILVTALADWRSRIAGGCQNDFVSVISKSIRPSDLVSEVAGALRAKLP